MLQELDPKDPHVWRKMNNCNRSHSGTVIQPLLGNIQFDDSKIADILTETHIWKSTVQHKYDENWRLTVENNTDNNNTLEETNLQLPPLEVHKCSVAEWLRQWANLGVITTTELLGDRGFESHSRHE